jgi:hypothetical protein
MIVMPSFTEGYHRKQEAVFAIVTGLVTRLSKDVGHGIDAAGAVKKKDRADESPPDQHLRSRRVQGWIEIGEQCSKTIGQDGKKKRADQIKPVQEDEFGEPGQIGDKGIIGGEIPAARHPADMRPEKALLPGRVDIDLLIRVRVMMAMNRRPPESSSLNAEKAEQGKKKLDPSIGLVRFVTEITMVDAGDKKHPHSIECPTDRNGYGTISNPEDPKATQVKDDKGNSPAPFHSFRHCPGRFDATWEVIGVYETNQVGEALHGKTQLGL